MAYIGNEPFPKGNFSATTHNGGTAVFTMGQSPGTKNAVLVFIDGVRQDPLNYSIAGTTLTLGTAAPAGTDNVQILVSGEELGVNVPADDSVTTVKILDDNVTLAKMAAGTDGNLITYDASGDPAHVATGTATHLLTSNGPGAAPTFQAAVVVVGVPSGCILMWSGAVSAIPTGWVICDGNNSTPNLTSRFVIHADADSGGSYDVDDTGGSTTSGAHTLLTAEMPSHTHTFNAYPAGSGSKTQSGRSDSAESQTTNATGGGGSHTHGSTIPPYLALAYIMKT